MLTALRDCTQVFSTLNRRFYCSNNSPYSRLLQELKECNRASNPFNFLSDREFHVYKKVLKVAPSEWNKISWENDTERKIYNKLFETQVLNSDLQDLNNYTWDNMFMQVEDLQLPLPFQKAIGDVVERTLVEYCPGMDSMLEIGSGPLPITEFLLRTPKKKKEQVILTDINDSCLKILRRQYPQTNVQKLDILSHNPLHPSYECIVMKDVFNIFTKQDLERSCKSVFNALKPGGHLIHFSIEIPIFTHLLDEFKCRDLIYLPIISENNAWEGIYVINREGFRYFLHNLNSSYQEMQELFLEYASTDPFTLDSIILEECFKSNDTQIFRNIIKLIETFNCPVIKKIYFEGYFHDNLKQTLNNLDFDIIKFKDEEGIYIGPQYGDLYRPDLEDNTPPGGRAFCQILDRDQRTIKESTITHVVVAQKKFNNRS